MATLRQLVHEHNARKDRLDHAINNGHRDCIPAERDNYEEFYFPFVELLINNVDLLSEAAGDLELGPESDGLSLAFSQDKY